MFKCGDILINNPKPGKCQNWVRGLKSRKITYSRFTIPKTERVPKLMAMQFLENDCFTIPKTGRVPKPHFYYTISHFIGVYELINADKFFGIDDVSTVESIPKCFSII